MDSVLLTFFVLTVVLQLALSLWLFTGIAHKSTSKNAWSVSVIIAARNEGKYLTALLERLKTQDHPNFEVLLVNDRSTDDTASILTKYRTSPWLHIITIEELLDGWNGKKYALKRGIDAAKNDVLLFTDADCVPQSNQWISEMTTKLNHKKDIVLGYAGYAPDAGLLNQFIQFDTIYTAFQYLGFASRQLPYMAVGRNWAVKKEVYPIHLLEQYAPLPGGDDDLIAQAICNAENTCIAIGTASSIISYPEKDWRSFLKQKIRHLAVGPKYSRFAQTISSIFPLLQGCVMVLLFVMLITGQWKIAILIYGIRSLSFYSIFKRLGQKLDSTFSQRALLWVQVCYPFWHIFVGIRSLATKQIEWKAESSFLKKH